MRGESIGKRQWGQQAEEDSLRSSSLVFGGGVWHSTGMGNKDARNREKKKPKKKVDKVVQAPPPIVRAPAPKP